MPSYIQNRRVSGQECRTETTNLAAAKGSTIAVIVAPALRYLVAGKDRRGLDPVDASFKIATVFSKKTTLVDWSRRQTKQ